MPENNDKVTKTSNKYIEELAKSIRADNPHHVKVDDEKKVFGDVNIPSVDDEEAPPEPIQLERGLAPDSAFSVKHDRDISDTLGSIFGYNDGDYFLHGLTTVHRKGKPFKVSLIEDKNGFQYRIWFDIERAGLLYGLNY